MSQRYVEALFTELCTDSGIPLIRPPETAISYRYLAWGCVRVKIKRAELKRQRGDNRFRFDFAAWEISLGLNCDVLVLVCEWERPRVTYHFFTPDDPVLYNGDKLKACVTFKPGAKIARRRNLPGMTLMTQAMMDAAENRIELIEAARVAFSNRLREQVP